MEIARSRRPRFFRHAVAVLLGLALVVLAAQPSEAARWRGRGRGWARGWGGYRAYRMPYRGFYRGYPGYGYGYRTVVPRMYNPGYYYGGVPAYGYGGFGSRMMPGAGYYNYSYVPPMM